MKDRFELKLRDGTPVIVRPLIEEDRLLVAEAYRRLSPEARYQRFWTRTGEMIGDVMLDKLIEQNPQTHVTWAVLDPAREFSGVGGASWWRNAAKPGEVEISAMVLDDDQHGGITLNKSPSTWGEGEFLLMRTTFEVDHLNYESCRLAILARQGFHVYLNGQIIHSYAWWQDIPRYSSIVLGNDKIQQPYKIEPLK